MKLQYKIVLSFTVLLIGALLITTLVSISLMTRNLEARVETQLEQASRMISRADFALNASILANFKTMLGADVVTYNSDGTVITRTLQEGEAVGLEEAVLANGRFSNDWMTRGDFSVRELVIDGRPYKIGYRPLASRPDIVIAVIAETSDLALTQEKIRNRLLLITALLIGLTVILSQRIAKGVTAPALRLVQFTKQIAAGERNALPVSGKDEIAVLTIAFNEMVEQLRRSEEKLLQSEKLTLTGILAARVAHEVRNPLSAIKMHAQLLRSKLPAGHDGYRMIDAMLREIERVEWVVRGMLDLATPPVLQLERANAIDVVEEVVVLMEPQLTHRKIAVNKSYDASVPEIELDHNRLKVAILNLVMNAAESMPTGGTIEAVVQKELDSVCIEIRDDGTGIDPAIRDRLFRPFVTTKREGVGLGLLNTKNTVEQHRGTIELVPRNGHGTRAIIRLPINRK